jgi:hypothetical protein
MEVHRPAKLDLPHILEFRLGLWAYHRQCGSFGEPGRNVRSGDNPLTVTPSNPVLLVFGMLRRTSFLLVLLFCALVSIAVSAAQSGPHPPAPPPDSKPAPLLAPLKALTMAADTSERVR